MQGKVNPPEAPRAKGGGGKGRGGMVGKIDRRLICGGGEVVPGLSQASPTLNLGCAGSG